MKRLDTIRLTARTSDALFRHAFPVYRALYEQYKRRAERAVIASIDAWVRRGDRVADIGANIGFYTALLAERVGPGGAVYAFEPEPLNFARLAARTARYAQTRTVAACVTDHDGSAELFLSPDLNVDHRSYSTGEPRRRMTVAAVTLDSYLSGGDTLRLVKMDVQGAEYAALLGMADVLARSPDVRLLMEVWPYVLERFGPGTGALLSLLDNWGFHVHRLDRAGGAGERLRPDAAFAAGDERDYFDVLCVRAAPARA